MTRTAVAIALLIALGIAAIRYGPHAWLHISTMPECDLGSSSGDTGGGNALMRRWREHHGESSGGLLDLVDSNLFDGGILQGLVRVRRWGERRGQRHGDFLAEFADGSIEGGYRDGKPSGVWRGRDGSQRLLWVALPLEPDSAGSHELGDIEVEIRADGRWRIPGCVADGWAPAKGAGFLAMEYGSGGFAVAEASLVEDESGKLGAPRLVRVGVLFEWSDSGALRGFGPTSSWGEDGLWTWFDDSGAIRAQAVYLMGEERDRRSEGPWYDLSAGLDATAPTIHPVTGRAVE